MKTELEFVKPSMSIDFNSYNHMFDALLNGRIIGYVVESKETGYWDFFANDSSPISWTFHDTLPKLKSLMKRRINQAAKKAKAGGLDPRDPFGINRLQFVK